MDWTHLLVFITGTINQELLLRNEYLVTENRILRNQLTGRVQLTDGERKALAEIGIAGVTPHPTMPWMMQVARNVTMEEWGFLSPGQYLIHDRDGKYCPAFQQLIDAAGTKRVPLPARSPNLNAYAERWVRSIRGVSLAIDLVWGSVAPPYADAVCDAFSSGAQSSGQGECAALSLVQPQTPE
jgi:hypothetical protein